MSLCLHHLPSGKGEEALEYVFNLVNYRVPSGRTRGMAFDLLGRLVMCESGGRRISRLQKDGSVYANHSLIT